MRDKDEPMTTSLPARSKGQQRKRRLARAVERWDFDRRLCAEPTRRVARITLTLRDPDPEQAIGRVYDFWRRVRQQWLGTRYFCWLELHKRGQVHYHCIWLNPPHMKKVNLLAWVDRAWGQGRTQVRFSDGRVGIERALNYVTNHTKKMGKKAYQQRYDDVPPQLRTFMNQRLEIPPEEVDKHLDRDVWAYHPTEIRLVSGRPGFNELVEGYLELIGRLVHVVPPAGRCSALDHRRTGRAPPFTHDAKTCRGAR